MEIVDQFTVQDGTHEFEFRYRTVANPISAQIPYVFDMTVHRIGASSTDATRMMVSLETLQDMVAALNDIVERETERLRRAGVELPPRSDADQ